MNDSLAITWLGTNITAVRAFARQACGYDFPSDWIEELPNGDLFLMAGMDGTMTLRVGEILRAESLAEMPKSQRGESPSEPT